jgi:hypothetical protein
LAENWWRGSLEPGKGHRILFSRERERERDREIYNSHFYQVPNIHK